ncbi:MAG: hypothetical protein GWP05_02765 [Anaerolineaceae bacterium]|nr:hypothetical protein [Anaerolineaceae bacterium]
MSDCFGRWLQKKYGTIAALNGAWRQRLSSFDQAREPQPPTARRRDDLPPQLDWLAFADRQRPRTASPSVLDYLREVVNASRTGDGLTRLYFRVRALCREPAADGRPRRVAEVCRAVGPLSDPSAVEFAVRAALMHGAAAEDRNLPAGCDLASLEPVLETLHTEPWELDRKVLILYPRIYAHLKLLADRAVEGGPGDDEGFGFERPIHTAGPALLKKFIDLAVQAGLSFALGDTRLPLEEIRRHALVICPTLEVMSSAAMRKLSGYVQDGGFLAIGPRIPLLNERMRSDDTLARHFPNGLSEFTLALVPCGHGGVFTLPGHVSTETIAYLAFESGLAKGLTAEAPQLDSAIFRCGPRRLLCVANPLDFPASTTFSGETVRELRDLETDHRQLLPAKNKCTIPAATVRFMEVL